VASSCVPLARSTSRVSDTRPPGRPPPNSISTPSGSATAGPGVASAITPARPRAAGRRPPRRGHAGMGHAPHATAWGVGWWPRPRPHQSPPMIWDPKNPHQDSGRALPPRVHTFGNDRIAAASSSVRSCRPEARSRHVERRGARSRAFVLLLSTAGGPTVRRCRWRG